MKRGAQIALRVSMGLVFVVSGTMKAIEPRSFIGTIQAFDLIPDPLVPFTAFTVVTGELFLGTLLLLGIAHRAAGTALIAVLMLFSAAIISALVRGIELSCGCFGAASDEPIGPWTILRNTLIILLLCIIIAPTPKDRV